MVHRRFLSSHFHGDVFNTGIQDSLSSICYQLCLYISFVSILIYLLGLV